MAPAKADRVRRVLFYGDSNTYGTDPAGGGRYPAGARWTDILAVALTGLWDVRVDARPGRCIPEMDFEWEDVRLCLGREAPLDMFAVMLGTNDYLSAARPDADAAAARMEGFLARLREREELQGSEMLVIAPPCLDFGDDRFYGPYSTTSGVLSRALEDCAAGMGVDFLNAGAWPLPLCGDGIHLSREGHRVFAAHMLRYFQEQR